VQKKIFVLVGHTYDDGKTGLLAKTYTEHARMAGHEVEYVCLGKLNFDPILRQGYREIQELEPCLKEVQNKIQWCDHFVVVYPIWWSSMPAILKGFFDRTWIPGFAYRFKENNMGWNKLLTGKTGRVIMTMNNWPLMSRLLFGDLQNEIDRAILEFSGIEPTKVSKFGRIESCEGKKLQKVLKKVAKLGTKGK
jgi:putative NADPH-quinone reductase